MACRALPPGHHGKRAGGRSRVCGMVSGAVRGVSRRAIALAATAAMLLLAADSPAAEPPLHTDRAEAAAPLDLVATRFGQTASTELELVIRTQLAFGPDDVDPLLGRTLCVSLRIDAAITPFSRVCVIRATGRPRASRCASRRSTRRATGSPPATCRRSSSDPARRRSRELRPGVAAARAGPLRWQVRSIAAASADRCPTAVRSRCGSPEPRRPRPPALLRRRIARPARALRQPLLLRTASPRPAMRPLAQNSPCTPLPARRRAEPVRVRRAGRRRARDGRPDRRQPRGALARGARGRRADAGAGAGSRSRARAARTRARRSSSRRPPAGGLPAGTSSCRAGSRAIRRSTRCSSHSTSPGASRRLGAQRSGGEDGRPAAAWRALPASVTGGSS